jgi:ERCC4-type nuclease
MKATYPKCLVLIEGSIDWHDPTMRGVMLSIMVDWGIPYINTKDVQGSIKVISMLFGKYGQYRSTREPPPAVRKSKKISEIKLAMCCCVEGIGIVTAKKLMATEPLIFSTVLGEEYTRKILKEIIGDKTLKQKMIQKRLLAVIYNYEDVKDV